jgi:hypothetical protein
MVKSQYIIKHHAIMAYGGLQVDLHALTSAVVDSIGQCHAFAAAVSGVETYEPTEWDAGWALEPV